MFLSTLIMRFKGRFKALACFLLISTVLFLWFGNPANDNDNYMNYRTLQLSKIDDLIMSQASHISCKQPVLPVYSSEISKFVHYVPNINCSGSGFDWVKCYASECVIQGIAILNFGSINCSFTDVIRVDDFHFRNGVRTTSDDRYKLEESDVVRVACKAAEKNWTATLTTIRSDKHISNAITCDKLGDSALKMNVLMFGFDSLSRNSFIRKLPKTYKYMSETLKTIVLQGYNIVGDGTPQALIPILTGKRELELPDTRKRLKNTEYVDSYPFIWNDFKDAGYVTGFFEDVPQTGTFSYRLNGFKEPPTDHYMRTYYLADLKEQEKWPPLCTGEIPRHKVMMNAVKDFFTVYRTKPMFLFAFHGELSHNDYNLVGVADDDLLEMLQDLNNSGALNNTILIVMADHGPRFAEIRATLTGRLEERLPFFSFTFPPWFKEKHKKAYSNLKQNQEKLTTPFDIYSTLQSVLNLQDGIADIRQRSVSLFSKIPAERSCADAHIEPHWCACLDWHKIPVSEPMVERLKETLVSTLNAYTAPYRDICDKLWIFQIVWAMRMTPNKNVLKFSRSLDVDGLVPDLSKEIKTDTETYQIQAVLMPGNSLFEASFTHTKRDDRLHLNMSDISRLNLYGRQARCVEHNLPQLRKYCYCKGD